MRNTFASHSQKCPRELGLSRRYNLAPGLKRFWGVRTTIATPAVSPRGATAASEATTPRATSRSRGSGLPVGRNVCKWPIVRHCGRPTRSNRRKWGGDSGHKGPPQGPHRRRSARSPRRLPNSEECHSCAFRANLGTMPHRPREPQNPQPRTETIRQSLLSLLAEEPRSLSELSNALRVSERELVDHLEHLLSGRRPRVTIVPSRCKACEFRFDTRARVRRPSRCPKCRSERLSQPRFWIERE
jgi:predicted Zn-ribbon and HTH transcriptional regulator